MKTARERLADKLQRLLDEYQWSHRYLADRMGVSPSTITHWITKKSFPRDHELDGLCNLFGIDLTELLSDRTSDIRKREVSDDEVIRSILNKYGIDAPKRFRKRERDN